MPQDVEFALPFTTRISPDVDAARTRSLDWWQGLGQGASAAWIDRTALHWGWHFDAYAEEADNRVRRRLPTVEEHFALRRSSTPCWSDTSGRVTRS
jgi:hypothetical protein